MRDDRGSRVIGDRFVDLADAGRRLAPLVVAALEGTGPAGGVIVLGVGPHGLPVATEVAAALGGSAVVPLEPRRDDDGVRVELPVPVGGRTVVIVDDGVETGTAALAIGAALRAAGAGRALLAVPVCPREAGPRLGTCYDQVIAVVRPLVRRSLRWHYDTLA